MRKGRDGERQVWVFIGGSFPKRSHWAVSLDLGHCSSQPVSLQGSWEIIRALQIWAPTPQCSEPWHLAPSRKRAALFPGHNL